MYLRHWRGRDRKSATARRYNCLLEGEKYVRMAWYADQMLYAILWQRAVHSGESISRMLDFAIRYYLPRLMEEYLRSPMPGCQRAAKNCSYWLRRYRERPNPQPEIFITYQCETHENSNSALEYSQEYRMYRKKDLLIAEIPY